MLPNPNVGLCQFCHTRHHKESRCKVLIDPMAWPTPWPFPMEGPDVAHGVQIRLQIERLIRILRSSWVGA